MRKVLICSLFILTSIAFILSCKKLDHLEEKEQASQIDPISKFFTVPADADRRVKAIAQSIYRQNQQRQFINSLVGRVGYPHWDKIMIASKKGANARTTTDIDSSSIVYIPFSKPDSNVTTSVLAVGLNYLPTDTLYHMIYPQQYKQYSFDTTGDGWNARSIFHLFTEFDYQIFGKKVISITDGRILGGEFEDSSMIRRVVNGTGASEGWGRTQNPTLIKVCAYFGPYWPARIKANRTTDAIWIPVCDYVWVDDPWEPGPLALPGQGGGGGSYTQASGGHWDTIPPCPEERRMIVGRTNGQPLACSFIGWQYIWVPDENTYFADYENWGYKHFETWDVTPEDYAKIENWRLNNIDTVGLDSCVRKILERILNGNNLIGKLLAKMERSNDFPLNIEQFKITIRVGSLPPGTVGSTDGHDFNPGTQIFKDTITIKDSLVMFGTEIGVARTLIHEIVHAYMMSLFLRFFYNSYTANQIASLNADSMFNVYIDTLLARHDKYNLNNWALGHPEYQHDFMADKVLNHLKEALARIDDYRNTDEYYWLITWGGLHNTRTFRKYWPNVPGWPPTTGHPAPSNDSIWGLKYAFTEARLDSLRLSLQREQEGLPLAKGRPKIPGACY